MIIDAVAVVAVVASVVAGIAIYKHGSVKAALVSAKKEGANIEAAVVNAEALVKTEVLAIVARIKAL